MENKTQVLDGVRLQWVTKEGELYSEVEAYNTCARVRVADDSRFPLRCDKTMCVRLSFKPGNDKLVIEKWRKTESS